METEFGCKPLSLKAMQDHNLLNKYHQHTTTTTTTPSSIPNTIISYQEEKTLADQGIIVSDANPDYFTEDLSSSQESVDSGKEDTISDATDVGVSVCSDATSGIDSMVS